MWARDAEDRTAKLTEVMTSFSSVSDLFIGLAVIALLPAIGEELVFRGLFQNELFRGSGNIHVSIWVSAIIFSAIHIQFYGFIPRVLLGALFGYLYFWSGNLLIPMLAHFTNNGFSVMMIYFNQKELAGVDLENPEAAPWYVAIVCTILTALLLYYFKKINYAKVPTA